MGRRPSAAMMAAWRSLNSRVSSSTSSLLQETRPLRTLRGRGGRIVFCPVEEIEVGDGAGLDHRARTEGPQPVRETGLTQVGARRPPPVIGSRPSDRRDRELVGHLGICMWEAARLAGSAQASWASRRRSRAGAPLASRSPTSLPAPRTKEERGCAGRRPGLVRNGRISGRVTKPWSKTPVRTRGKSTALIVGVGVVKSIRFRHAAGFYR